MVNFVLCSAVLCGALALVGTSAAVAQAQQRVLGVDISYWNAGTSSNGISQANWNTGYTTGNRQFAFIRATRGGTTGVDRPAGTPFGHDGASTLSRRYDDPRFLQNITRATAAGMLAGPYHYGRPEIAGNTGTDEADHFIQMAGLFMRPGYMMPVFDLEAGTAANNLATFSLDFSNRLYNVMGIRPAMYINGNHTNHLVNSASGSQLQQIAQPAANGPSVVGPAFPMLWNARYHDQTVEGFDPETIPVQTGSPKTSPSNNSSYYGPWDDYGDAAPWSFWQYASVMSIPGFNNVDATIDGNVSHGDIEYVRNYLVPAVWSNNSSGDWSTLANWNSGQAVITPTPGTGQTTPYSYDAGLLPTARLPGAAGSGPTSGQYDTVILERPSANITVTLSTGAHNIRKLFVRETLNITGGSLTINYDPTYRPDNSSLVRHGGLVSAQFSGAVSISGGASLSVHTLNVDATRTFTIGDSSVALDTINLGPHASTPAKISVTGDVNFSPLDDAAATIRRNPTGSGNTGTIDLTGARRVFNVANGAAAIDLSINVPVINGGLTKSGPGTLELTGANTYAGDTIVEAGRLILTTKTLANGADVHLLADSSLDLDYSGGDIVNALFIDGIMRDAGTWGSPTSGAQFTSDLFFGTGRLQVNTSPSVGDFNRDGFVDGDDLDEWAGGYGNEYDGADFLAWQRDLGNRTSSGAIATAVPEPTTAAMALIAVGASVGLMRRARHRLAG